MSTPCPTCRLLFCLYPGAKWQDNAKENGEVTITKLSAERVRFAPHPDECWAQQQYEFPRNVFLANWSPVAAELEALDAKLGKGER